MGNFGFYYSDHSRLHRAIEAHYRARGVTSETKLWSLVYRWKRTNGLRFPATVTGDSSG